MKTSSLNIDKKFKKNLLKILIPQLNKILALMKFILKRVYVSNLLYHQHIWVLIIKKWNFKIIGKVNKVIMISNKNTLIKLQMSLNII